MNSKSAACQCAATSSAALQSVLSGNAAVLDSALASAAKEIAAGREAPAAQALAGCRLGYPTIR
jgi:hypothetical protein